MGAPEGVGGGEGGGNSGLKELRDYAHYLTNECIAYVLHTVCGII